MRKSFEFFISYVYLYFIMLIYMLIYIYIYICVIYYTCYYQCNCVQGNRNVMPQCKELQLQIIFMQTFYFTEIVNIFLNSIYCGSPKCFRDENMRTIMFLYSWRSRIIHKIFFGYIFIKCLKLKVPGDFMCVSPNSISVLILRFLQNVMY